MIETARRHGGCQSGRVAERVRVRDLSSQEGSRLPRIVHRDAGSVATACRTYYGLMDGTVDVEPCCPVATTQRAGPCSILSNLSAALCSVDRSGQSVQPA